MDKQCKNILLPNVPKYMGEFLPNILIEKLRDDTVLTRVIEHKVKHPIQAFFWQVKRAFGGGIVLYSGKYGNCSVIKKNLIHCVAQSEGRNYMICIRRGCLNL